MELVRGIFRLIGQRVNGFRVAGNYNSASNGTYTLNAAATPDRNVLVVTKVTATFADNGGTKPTVKIGQTGSTSKFAGTGAFSSGVVGDVSVFAGVLSGSAALLVTVVAGVGAGAGGVSVEVIILPSTA